MVRVEIGMCIDDTSHLSSLLWWFGVVQIYFSSFDRKLTCKWLLNGQLGDGTVVSY